MTFLNNKYWNMYQESFYFIVMQNRHFLLKHQKYQRSKNATIENYITWIANYLQIGIALKTNRMQIKIVYKSPTCEKNSFILTYILQWTIWGNVILYSKYLLHLHFPANISKRILNFCTVVLRQWWIIIMKKEMPLLWSDNWHSLRMKGLAAW